MKKCKECEKDYKQEDMNYICYGYFLCSECITVIINEGDNLHEVD